MVKNSQVKYLEKGEMEFSQRLDFRDVYIHSFNQQTFIEHIP